MSQTFYPNQKQNEAELLAFVSDPANQPPCAVWLSSPHPQINAKYIQQRFEVYGLRAAVLADEEVARHHAEGRGEVVELQQTASCQLNSTPAAAQLQTTT